MSVYARVADDTLRPWPRTHGREHRDQPGNEAGEGPRRQAARRAAPLGAPPPRLREPRHAALEHEGDQQDDQDDQKDRSNTDVHVTPSLVGYWSRTYCPFLPAL